MSPKKWMNIFPLLGHINSIEEMPNNYTESFCEMYQILEQTYF